MNKAMLLLLSVLFAAAMFGQSGPSAWQVATIMDAKPHPNENAETKDDVARYDVTVRVADTEYVVLYTPPDGTLKDIVKYHLGQDGLVLVGPETIKYNDAMGRTIEVPIIAHRKLAPEAKDTHTKEKKN